MYGGEASMLICLVFTNFTRLSKNDETSDKTVEAHISIYCLALISGIIHI